MTSTGRDPLFLLDAPLGPCYATATSHRAGGSYARDGSCGVHGSRSRDGRARRPRQVRPERRPRPGRHRERPSGGRGGLRLFPGYEASRIRGLRRTAASAALINKSCVGFVKKCASHSKCGKANAVTCCLSTAKGTKCKTKPDAAHCTAKQGTIGTCTSCCDACPTPGS